jgi:serine/threonine-protein kinase
MPPSDHASTSPRPSVRPGGPASLIGTTISGRYRIEKLLGEGGMGAVYQAEHTHMRKRLAIKVLHPEMSRLPEVVARFEREAMAAAHIDHPNVATATDFGKLDDGSFFLVLEFVEGKSLRDSVQKGPLELGRALRILRQIAAALQRAHAIGIVHRDLKPENVMLIDRDGEPDFVKVLDFGIAKVPVGDISTSGAKSDQNAPALTQLGMVYGTPEYMAPEQALGQNVDPRADIYALGVMAFEMLAGKRPFDHESKVTLLGMHVTAPVPPISAKAPEVHVPQEVEAIIIRMLAKESTYRHADAKELLEALDAIWIPAYGSPPGAPQSALPRMSLAGVNPNSLSGPMSANASRASLPGVSPGLLPSTSGGLPAFQNSTAALLDRVQTMVKTNPRPFMIGGAGVAVLLAIVFLVVVVAGASGTKTDADAGVAASPSSTSNPTQKPDDVEVQIKAAVELVDKGDYGTGIDRLTQIEKEHGDRADIHRALERAYTATKNPKEAIREAELWLKADPEASRDVKLQENVRNAAIGALGKEGIDPAFALLEHGMGPVGPDLLYDIAHGQSGVGYPQAASRAQKSLARADVRGLASPALLITLDLRSANDCEARKRLFDRARESGDSRTMVLLKAWVPTRGCGGGIRGGRDCNPCMHRDGSLAKTIDAVAERTKP